MTAERILEIARGELGVKESPPNSNRVKYNTAYYGREVSGSNYAWCAVFVWWCFRAAEASELYYGGGKNANCPSLLNFHRQQKVSGDYRPGDVIFFNFSGKKNAAHVGICESWDGAYITTIDGNTAPTNEANGGAVMRRRRHKKYIVGAYRPGYREVETVSYEQWKEYMDRYRKELGTEAPAPYAVPHIETCIDAGIMSEINGTIDRPGDFHTRKEAAVMPALTLKAAK